MIGGHDRRPGPAPPCQADVVIYDPLAWGLAALGARALAVNLPWVLGDAARPPIAPPGGLQAWRRRGEVALAARACYLLGVPLGALALRVVPPALLGLTLPLDARSWLFACATCVVTVGIVVAARADVGSPRRGSSEGAPPRPRAALLGAVALDAVLIESHWAFFRAVGLAVGPPSVTLGAYIGVALLAIEAWLDPAQRTIWTAPEPARRAVVSAALAIQSTTVFLLTGSSLLALGTHLLTAGTFTLRAAQHAPVPGAHPGGVVAPRVDPTVI
jgi:hypothetical protein